jgi:hypothetical protein
MAVLADAVAGESIRHAAVPGRYRERPDVGKDWQEPGVGVSFAPFNKFCAIQ